MFVDPQFLHVHQPAAAAGAPRDPPADPAPPTATASSGRNGRDARRRITRYHATATRSRTTMPPATNGSRLARLNGVSHFWRPTPGCASGSATQSSPAPGGASAIVTCSVGDGRPDDANEVAGSAASTSKAPMRASTSVARDRARWSVIGGEPSEQLKQVVDVVDGRLRVHDAGPEVRGP